MTKSVRPKLSRPPPLGRRASRPFGAGTGPTGVSPVRRLPIHFPFFAARRSRLGFGTVRAKAELQRAITAAVANRTPAP